MSDLSIYWDLASPNAQTRVYAALKLSQSLKNPLTKVAEDQTKNDQTVFKHKNPAIQYAINRLIKGLASSTDCARQGFSLALTLILRSMPEISKDAVIQAIDTIVKNQNIVSEDIKDRHAARIFGYLAIERIGYFSSEASKLQLNAVLEHLMESIEAKFTLRESGMTLLFSIMFAGQSHSPATIRQFLVKKIKGILQYIATSRSLSANNANAANPANDRKGARKDPFAFPGVEGAVDPSYLYLLWQAQVHLSKKDGELSWMGKNGAWWESNRELVASALLRCSLECLPRLSIVWESFGEIIFDASCSGEGLKLWERMVRSLETGIEGEEANKSIGERTVLVARVLNLILFKYQNLMSDCSQEEKKRCENLMMSLLAVSSPLFAALVHKSVHASPVVRSGVSTCVKEMCQILTENFVNASDRYTRIAVSTFVRNDIFLHQNLKNASRELSLTLASKILFLIVENVQSANVIISPALLSAVSSLASSLNETEEKKLHQILETNCSGDAIFSNSRKSLMQIASSLPFDVSSQKGDGVNMRTLAIAMKLYQAIFLSLLSPSEAFADKANETESYYRINYKAVLLKVVKKLCVVKEPRVLENLTAVCELFVSLISKEDTFLMPIVKLINKSSKAAKKSKNLNEWFSILLLSVSCLFGSQVEKKLIKKSIDAVLELQKQDENDQDGNINAIIRILIEEVCEPCEQEGVATLPAKITSLIPSLYIVEEVDAQLKSMMLILWKRVFALQADAALLKDISLACCGVFDEDEDMGEGGEGEEGEEGEEDEEDEDEEDEEEEEEEENEEQLNSLLEKIMTTKEKIETEEVKDVPFFGEEKKGEEGEEKEESDVEIDGDNLMDIFLDKFDDLPEMPLALKGPKNLTKIQAETAEKKTAEEQYHAVLLMETAFFACESQDKAKFLMHAFELYNACVSLSKKMNSGGFSVDMRNVFNSSFKKMVGLVEKILQSVGEMGEMGEMLREGEERKEELQKSVSEFYGSSLVKFPGEKNVSGEVRALLVRSGARLCQVASRLEKEVFAGQILDEGKFLDKIFDEWCLSKKSRLPSELLRLVVKKNDGAIFDDFSFARLHQDLVQNKPLSLFKVRELLAMNTSLVSVSATNANDALIKHLLSLQTMHKFAYENFIKKSSEEKQVTAEEEGEKGEKGEKKTKGNGITKKQKAKLQQVISNAKKLLAKFKTQINAAKKN